MPTPPNPDRLSHSDALAVLLAPRHESGVPYHVYTMTGDAYEVRRYGAPDPFPEFWWTMRGRVLEARLLPASVEGIHVVITYFQFNAVREEVFQTVHLDGQTATVKAVAGDHETAREHHRRVYDSLITALPASDDDLPDWL